MTSFWRSRGWRSICTKVIRYMTGLSGVAMADLVDGRNDPRSFNDAFKVRHLEVGHADS